MRKSLITLGYSSKRKQSGTITIEDSRPRDLMSKLEARPLGKWLVDPMRLLRKSKVFQGTVVLLRPSRPRHTENLLMSMLAARRLSGLAQETTKRMSARTVIRNRLVTNSPKLLNLLLIQTTLMCVRIMDRMNPIHMLPHESMVLRTNLRGQRSKVFERIAVRPLIKS